MPLSLSYLPFSFFRIDVCVTLWSFSKHTWTLANRFPLTCLFDDDCFSSSSIGMFADQLDTIFSDVVQAEFSTRIPCIHCMAVGYSIPEPERVPSPGSQFTPSSSPSPSLLPLSSSSSIVQEESSSLHGKSGEAEKGGKDDGEEGEEGERERLKGTGSEEREMLRGTGGGGDSYSTLPNVASSLSLTQGIVHVTCVLCNQQAKIMDSRTCKRSSTKRRCHF